MCRITRIVAGVGFEPTTQGYEPDELPGKRQRKGAATTMRLAAYHISRLAKSTVSSIIQATTRRRDGGVASDKSRASDEHRQQGPVSTTNSSYAKYGP
jgi:hypothetical protein